MGGYSTVNGGFPLAEHWNGSSWMIQPVPSPAGATSPQLTGVSCSTARDCTAVGFHGRVSFVEHWNGSRWRIQPNPSAAWDSLSGVSCATAGNCIAVGSSGHDCPSSGCTASNPSITILAERWDGISWKLQTVPNPDGAGVSSLDGVSCLTGGECTAVGYYSAAGPFLTLAEHWSGSTWTIQPSPDPVGSLSSNLNGVSCVTPSDCTAVGYFLPDGPGLNARTLGEHWDGTSWTIEPTPNLDGVNLSGFLSVSCRKPGACIAVGAAGSGLEALQSSVVGEQVVVSPVRGTVLVAVPSAKGAHFVALRREREIPVGSTLDTDRGAVSVTSAVNSAGETQIGEFHGGIFKVLQKRAAGAGTVLRLTARLACAGAVRHAADLASAAHGKRHRHLWANSSAHFGTRGGYGAASASGAHWLTNDSCTGTRFTVVHGAVRVTDFVRHKTILVRAGHRYLAGH